MPSCLYAWGLYCEEVYTGKQVKPGANKSGSKYSIVKKLGGGRPEKTNVEFVPLEIYIYIFVAQFSQWGGSIINFWQYNHKEHQWEVNWGHKHIHNFIVYICRHWLHRSDHRDYVPKIKWCESEAMPVITSLMNVEGHNE